MIELSRTHIPCTHLVALIATLDKTPRRKAGQVSLVQVEAIVHLRHGLSQSEQHMPEPPPYDKDVYTYLVRDAAGYLDLIYDLEHNGFVYAIARAENVKTVDDVTPEHSCLINANIHAAYKSILEKLLS